MNERDRIIVRMQKRIEELEYLVDLQRKAIKKHKDVTDAMTRGEYSCLEPHCPHRVVQRIRRIEYRR